MIDHNEAAAARQFEEPFIFPEEEELLGLLEDAGVASDVNDKAVALLRTQLELVARYRWHFGQGTKSSPDQGLLDAEYMEHHVSDDAGGPKPCRFSPPRGNCGGGQ